MIVLKPEEMKEMDRKTIEEGYPEILLMEAAGRGTARMCWNNAGTLNKILIICGKGNNGGDGLAAARFLHRNNYEIEIILMGSESDLEGITLKNYRLCQMRNLNIIQYSDLTLKHIKSKIKQAEIIIDAMLGTGLKGELRGNIAEMVELINNYSSDKSLVFAVDVPTGISGFSGKVLGKAIKADYTATMAFLKIGLCVYPGKEYAGTVEIIDIGMPEKTSIDQGNYSHFLLDESEASNYLPVREKTGHKGTFGKIGIIGGSPGMSGAPYLAGHASLKTGAGLVRLAVPESIQDTVASYTSELITLGLPDDKNGLIENALSSIKEFMHKQDVLAMGPGIGRSQAVECIVKKVLENFKGPLVLDADGINVIKEEDLNKRKGPLILTPHPGEMARLLDMEIKEVQENRIEISRNIARKYGVYLVLKGAASIIALPDGRIYINPTGNESMATAGSGDVLTGIISGLIAQGVDYAKGVVLGVYLHGLTGDIAREDLTSQSVNAGDLINYIAEGIKYLNNLQL